MEEGASFSESLECFPDVFSELYVNMVRAGEVGGMLDVILLRLSDYLEKTSRLQRKVKSALMYPISVTMIALVITILLLVKVVPTFEDIFASFGAALPLPTQLLLSVSDFMKNNMPYLLVLIVGIGLFIRKWKKTKKGRKFFDGLMLKVPIFGILLRKVAIAKFSRTFSTLVRSGVPILEALDIVGKTSGNVIIEEAVEHTKESVREGKPMVQPLEDSDVFPPMVIKMIMVGEQTGALEEMLGKIADFYDEQVDTDVSGLTSLIEPLLIAFLGVVIGGIVMAMFLPMFKMVSIVQ